MLPNPPFLSPLHIGRSYVNRVVRRIEAQNNERYRRRHHHQSYTRFASSVRSVLYPSTISLPRLSWAHCSPAAGKWRRESKNPRRKQEKHGDFSSNPATRLAWLEIGRNDPERSSVSTRETQKLGEGESAPRLEEEKSRKVFYFSADFLWILSYFIVSLAFQRLFSRFVKGMRFTNWLINTHGESSNDEYILNGQFWNSIRTGKTDFVIELQVGFAYPVYAVVDDTANNERTYRESETKRRVSSVLVECSRRPSIISRNRNVCYVRTVVNRLGLFLPRKKRRNRVNRWSSRGEVENSSRGSITVTCINGGKRFVLSSDVAITNAANRASQDFFHSRSFEANFFNNRNSNDFFQSIWE